MCVEVLRRICVRARVLRWIGVVIEECVKCIKDVNIGLVSRDLGDNIQV